MIDIAAKYESELKDLFTNIGLDLKYMFAFCGNYRKSYTCSENTWSSHEFVSIDKDSNVIGYFSYEIDRTTNNASGLSIINFSDNPMFGLDLLKLFDDIFMKFKFNKLNFGCYTRNPAIEKYERIVNNFGGRVVGVYKNEDILLDGEFHDKKVFEVTRLDYVNRY